MTMTQVAYPIAPAVTKPKGTLLDAATVTDDFKWLDGGNALFDSYNCLKFQEQADFCVANEKDFSQAAAWQDSFRFAAYGGVTCKAVGLDMADMKAKVSAAFRVGESVAVERALMATRFVENDNTGIPGEWDAPEDITPAGGAVNPAVGLAMLEAHARDNYVGAPTLHVPVVIASLILGVDGAEFTGNTLMTRLGSKIAAGGGYDYPNTGPDGEDAADGEKWLYATGGVWVGRGPTSVIQAFNQETNEVTVMGERPYIMAVDCYTAAVRVEVTA